MNIPLSPGTGDAGYQHAFERVLAPIVVAWLTIPELGTVLRSAPGKALLITFVLGMIYGIGGTAFGMAIRYVGYSLTYAIAIGISCVLGTWVGPIWEGKLGSILDKSGSGWVIAGVFIGLLGTLMWNCNETPAQALNPSSSEKASCCAGSPEYSPPSTASP